MGLTGANIIGGNPRYGREKDDYYATPPAAVEKLLNRHFFRGGVYLEPCAGNGNIAEVLRDRGWAVDCVDIIDRGCPGTVVADYLTWQPDRMYDGIITNPPYKFAAEFIERGLTMLKPGGQMAMFLKIQFLEGEKRRRLFDKWPPRYIYVFRKRISTWSNGVAYNPVTGEKWSGVMCMAWYVWDGTRNEPVVRWID